MSQFGRYYWQILVAHEPIHFSDLPVGSSFVLRLSWEDYQSPHREQRSLPTIMVKLSETEYVSMGITGAQTHTYITAPAKLGLEVYKDCHEVKRY